MGLEWEGPENYLGGLGASSANAVVSFTGQPNTASLYLGTTSADWDKTQLRFSIVCTTSPATVKTAYMYKGGRYYPGPSEDDPRDLGEDSGWVFWIDTNNVVQIAWNMPPDEETFLLPVLTFTTSNDLGDVGSGANFTSVGLGASSNLAIQLATAEKIIQKRTIFKSTEPVVEKCCPNNNGFAIAITVLCALIFIVLIVILLLMYSKKIKKASKSL